MPGQVEIVQFDARDPAGIDAEFPERRHKVLAVQRVQPRERALAAAHFFRRRGIAKGPCIGEPGRVDGGRAMPGQER